MDSFTFQFPDDITDFSPAEEQELASADKELNERQELFCHEYMVDFNAGLAAMRAGYKPYGASHTAYRLLRTTAVKKRIRELKKEQREQSHISFGFIAKKLLQLANDAMEGDPVLVYDPAIKTWKDTGRRKLDRPTALKALSLLGKHIGMFDKEYAEMIEKKEEYTQEEQEKQTQLVDAYLDASINCRKSKEENQRLKAALAEAGIELKPVVPEPDPLIKELGEYYRKPYVHKGPIKPVNPSEYDDKPHYEYKHITPYKNHPEHQLATPEQITEAKRREMSRLASGKTKDSGANPDV